MYVPKYYFCLLKKRNTHFHILKLNLDLNVDEAGIPIGCKGLANFNMGVWNKAKRGNGKFNPGWLNQELNCLLIFCCQGL